MKKENIEKRNENFLGQSGEDYLEAVLVFGKDQGCVRIVQISNYLGYSAPSVSVAVRKLVEKGYLKCRGKRGYSLTEKGRNLAEKVYERHGVLQKFLMYLGIIVS